MSWAHADQPVVERLMSRLRPELESLAGMRVKLWSDSEIHLGDDWRREILARLDECDYALALISPHYITRPFIVEEEIPRIAGSQAVTWVLPVGLKPVSFDGSRDLHGLEIPQSYLHRASSGRDRFFSELTTPAAQDNFAAKLATRIRHRILRDVGRAP
ncbi:MAG: toll/interleukin-1 receptor domain-containing protein [Tetrasphaera sp.]